MDAKQSYPSSKNQYFSSSFVSLFLSHSLSLSPRKWLVDIYAQLPYLILWLPRVSQTGRSDQLPETEGGKKDLLRNIAFTVSPLSPFSSITTTTAIAFSVPHTRTLKHVQISTCFPHTLQRHSIHKQIQQTSKKNTHTHTHTHTNTLKHYTTYNHNKSIKPSSIS